jgi:hypothetical protein
VKQACQHGSGLKHTELKGGPCAQGQGADQARGLKPSRLEPRLAAPAPPKARKDHTAASVWPASTQVHLHRPQPSGLRRGVGEAGPTLGPDTGKFPPEQTATR